MRIPGTDGDLLVVLDLAHVAVEHAELGHLVEPELPVVGAPLHL